MGEISELLGATLVGANPDTAVRQFEFDSRQVNAGDLYVAVRGENVDGHKFCKSALEKGAMACLVEESVEGPHLIVANVIQALAELGRKIRATKNIPIVGITGSAGKTTTKEFVAAALEPRGQVLRNVGNRNSEFTSPLVWLEADEDVWAGVVEMGMRGFGQIAHLASISSPTIGLITNIGWAHIDMVGGRQGIAKAKSELFMSLPSNGKAIYWAEDEFRGQLLSAAPCEALRFGFGPCESQVLSYASRGSSSFLRGITLGQEWEAEMPFSGKVMALNVAAALLVAKCLGVDIEASLAKISQVELPPLRNEWIDVNGARLLVDVYNSNPASAIAALETVAEAAGEGEKVAFLGTMRELGQWEQEGHELVGKAAARLGFERIVLFGPGTEYIGEGAKGVPHVEVAASIEDLQMKIEQLTAGQTALIKGSRAMEMERALSERLKGVGH